MDTVLLSRLQFALTTIYHWLFVPLTLGTRLVRGIHANSLLPDQGRNLAYDVQVLGKIVPDQLRHWRGDRYCAGIPVRYELE